MPPRRRRGTGTSRGCRARRGGKRRCGSPVGAIFGRFGLAPPLRTPRGGGGTGARAGLRTGWTRQHTGVLVRYECAAPETLASMAKAAVTCAMRDAAVPWSEIDLIVDASNCRYQPIPSNSAYLQHTLGPDAAGIPCIDVQSTCLGFIVALHMTNALLATGAYRHILITCSEQP